MYNVWCKQKSNLYNLHDFISEVPILQWYVVKYIQHAAMTSKLCNNIIFFFFYAILAWIFMYLYIGKFLLLFCSPLSPYCWRMLGPNLDCCIDTLTFHAASHLTTSCGSILDYIFSTILCYTFILSTKLVAGLLVPANCISSLTWKRTEVNSDIRPCRMWSAMSGPTKG